MTDSIQVYGIPALERGDGFTNAQCTRRVYFCGTMKADVVLLSLFECD